MDTKELKVKTKKRYNKTLDGIRRELVTLRAETKDLRLPFISLLINVAVIALEDVYEPQ